MLVLTSILALDRAFGYEHVKGLVTEVEDCRSSLVRWRIIPYREGVKSRRRTLLEEAGMKPRFSPSLCGIHWQRLLRPPRSHVERPGSPPPKSDQSPRPIDSSNALLGSGTAGANIRYEALFRPPPVAKIAPGCAGAGKGKPVVPSKRKTLSLNILPT